MLWAWPTKKRLYKAYNEIASPYLYLYPIFFPSNEFFWALETNILDFIFQSCSASALQARLKVAAHEAEEESDNIAEDFLEGKTDIDDFLSSFMEKRTVCNTLRLRTSDSIIANYLHIFMSKRTLAHYWAGVLIAVRGNWRASVENNSNILL